MLQRRPRTPGQHDGGGAGARPPLRQDIRGPLAARTATTRQGAGNHRRGDRAQARPHGHDRRDRHGQRQEPGLRHRSAVRAHRARRRRAGMRAVAQRRGPPRPAVGVRGGRVRPGRAEPRLADHGPRSPGGADGRQQGRHAGRGGGAGDDGRARRPGPPLRQRTCAARPGALPQQRGVRAPFGFVPRIGRPRAVRRGRPAHRARRVHGRGHRAARSGPAVLHPGAAPGPGRGRPRVRGLCAGRVDESSRGPARQPARDRPAGAGRPGGRPRAGDPAGRGDVPRGGGPGPRADGGCQHLPGRGGPGTGRPGAGRPGQGRRPRLDHPLRRGLPRRRTGALPPGPGAGRARRPQGEGGAGGPPAVPDPAPWHRPGAAGHGAGAAASGGAGVPHGAAGDGTAGDGALQPGCRISR